MTTPENNQIFERMELITGSEAFNKLTKTRVAVFGIGGVGSWAVEALVRSGVVEITIIDD
ncbi:MAG: tRNA threonylcarbamoyladenosine dehydratase, partial [bacterium]|nr:tRNA threonylcarbamoyladenosine dehydratase [bacterium]